MKSNAANDNAASEATARWDRDVVEPAFEILRHGTKQQMEGSFLNTPYPEVISGIHANHFTQTADACSMMSRAPFASQDGWTTLLSMVFQQNTAIRHAHLAVLDLASSRRDNKSREEHYRKALEYYDIALHEARKLHDNHLETVICVAFFLIFESIFGDREAAQVHWKGGKELFDMFEYKFSTDRGFRAMLCVGPEEILWFSSTELRLILPSGLKFEALVMQLAKRLAVSDFMLSADMLLTGPDAVSGVL